MRRQMFLVRFLVLTEARVTVNAINRLVRIRYVQRSESPDLQIECFHQLPHRLFDLLVEYRLARQKPVTIVVACKTAKECDSFLRKTRKTWIEAIALPYN